MNILSFMRYLKTKIINIYFYKYLIKNVIQ